MEKMKISATVVADTINPSFVPLMGGFGSFKAMARVTSMLVTMPRFILAEFNTHRVFSRNSASSRAIPFEKMVESIEKDPFIPIAWQKEHKGMQGSEYFEDVDDIKELNMLWCTSKENAIDEAIILNRKGATKQLCNRILEPFMWHTVLVTSTEWENFFELRCPSYEVNGKTFRSWQNVVADEFMNGSDENKLRELRDTPLLDKLYKNKGMAEIHMMALAEAMYDALGASIPTNKVVHLPFRESIAEAYPEIQDDYDTMVKVSVAACARTSYIAAGEKGFKTSGLEKDIALHNDLFRNKHMSPFEHIAIPVLSHEIYDETVKNEMRNFVGFKQYRAIIERSKS